MKLSSRFDACLRKVVPQFPLKRALHLAILKIKAELARCPLPSSVFIDSKDEEEKGLNQDEKHCI